MQYNDGLKKLVLAFSSGSPIFHRVPLYFLSGAHIFLRVPLYFLSGAHIFLRVPIFFIGYPYFSSGTHIAANFVRHLAQCGGNQILSPIFPDGGAAAGGLFAGDGSIGEGGGGFRRRRLLAFIQVNTEEEKQHGHHDVHRKLKEKKHL